MDEQRARGMRGRGDGEREQRGAAEPAPRERRDEEAAERRNARDHADRERQLDEAGRVLAQREDQIEGHFDGSFDATGMQQIERSRQTRLEQCGRGGERHRHRRDRERQA
jgi:hypothetical protein